MHNLVEHFLLLLSEDRWDFLLTKVPNPEELNAILVADPTSKATGGGKDGKQVKAGAYAEWIVRNYLAMSPVEQRRFREEDREKTYADLKTYHAAKPRMTQNMRDINKAFPAKGADAFVQLFRGAEIMRDRRDDKTDAEKAAADTLVLHKDSQWLIAVPKTYEAMRSLGGNSRWCNYASESYFSTYRQQGYSVVVVAGADEKYQLHWPSAQFMDIEDRPVDLPELLERIGDTGKQAIFNFFAETRGGIENNVTLTNILIDLDFDQGVEVAVANNWVDDNPMLKNFAVTKKRLTPEEVNTPLVTYLGGNRAEVFVGEEDDDLSDIADILCKRGDTIMHYLDYDNGWDHYYGDSADLSDLWDEIDGKNMDRITELAQQIAKANEIDPADYADLKDMLEEEDGAFDDLITAIRRAGDDANASAEFEAYKEAAIDQLRDKLMGLRYDNGWRATVAVDRDLLTFARENDLDLGERDLLDVYCKMVVEGDGYIHDEWSRYKGIYGSRDEDYFNELLSTQLYEVEP